MVADAFFSNLLRVQTMHLLSDDQAQQLTGGRFRSFLSTSSGLRSRRGFGLLLSNSMFSLRSLFSNVNQVNVAVNLALNGGTVINNQANILAINTIL
jgi:hypothetical protein